MLASFLSAAIVDPLGRLLTSVNAAVVPEIRMRLVSVLHSIEVPSAEMVTFPPETPSGAPGCGDQVAPELLERANCLDDLRGGQMSLNWGVWIETDPPLSVPILTITLDLEPAKSRSAVVVHVGFENPVDTGASRLL